MFSSTSRRRNGPSPWWRSTVTGTMTTILDPFDIASKESPPPKKKKMFLVVRPLRGVKAGPLRKKFRKKDDH